MSKIKGLFHKKFLRKSGEILGKISGKQEIITVQHNIKTRENRNIFRECHQIKKLRGYSKFPEEGMPGEAHVYFTAFSSERKVPVMFCVK